MYFRASALQQNLSDVLVLCLSLQHQNPQHYTQPDEYGIDGFELVGVIIDHSNTCVVGSDRELRSETIPISFTAARKIYPPSEAAS